MWLRGYLTYMLPLVSPYMRRFCSPPLVRKLRIKTSIPRLPSPQPCRRSERFALPWIDDSSAAAVLVSTPLLSFRLGDSLRLGCLGIAVATEQTFSGHRF